MSELIGRRAFLTGVGIAGLGAAALLAGCAPTELTPVPSDDDATDIAVTVQVSDNRFEPAEVTIKPGQAVRWEFLGTAKHDVVSDDRIFVSELMRDGSYTHVFDAAGEFPYLCSIHAEMRGVVTVASL